LFIRSLRGGIPELLASIFLVAQHLLSLSSLMKAFMTLFSDNWSSAESLAFGIWALPVAYWGAGSPS
jgi:hypothetical protein